LFTAEFQYDGPRGRNKTLEKCKGNSNLMAAFYMESTILVLEIGNS